MHRLDTHRFDPTSHHHQNPNTRQNQGWMCQRFQDNHLRDLCPVGQHSHHRPCPTRIEHRSRMHQNDLPNRLHRHQGIHSDQLRKGRRFLDNCQRELRPHCHRNHHHLHHCVVSVLEGSHRSNPTIHRHPNPSIRKSPLLMYQEHQDSCLLDIHPWHLQTRHHPHQNVGLPRSGKHR